MPGTELKLSLEGLLELLEIRDLRRDFMAAIDDLNAAVDKLSAAVTANTAEIADLRAQIAAGAGGSTDAAVENAAGVISSLADQLSAADTNPAPTA